MEVRNWGMVAGLLHIQCGAQFGFDDHCLTQNRVQRRPKTDTLNALVNRTDLGGGDVLYSLEGALEATLLLAVVKHLFEEAELVFDTVQIALIGMNVGRSSDLKHI